jgi:hypothetical protein
VLLFSGLRGDISQFCASWMFGDTWTWDGRNWTRLNPASSPPGRSLGAMAYDAAGGNTVLFGGGWANSDAPVTDTWTWDGTSWTQRHPAVSPPYLLMASATYDAARQVVMLVGGGDPFQTWTWNRSTWVQQHPAHSPSGRFDAAMAYDASTKRVVLFGGYFPGDQLTDTWTWDGSDWRQERPRTAPPVGEGFAAYDNNRQNVVLFIAGQTWTWNGTDWTLQHPAVSPPTRVNSRMVYDEAVGKVVVFGGKVQAMSGGMMTETVTNETWLWDGTTWTLAA